MNKEVIKAMDKYLEEYTPEEKKIIRKQFFPPNASDVDMMYCMNVAKQLGLNPILKEIYFIERKVQVNGKWVSKIEPMLGRNSYLTIAHRSGQFDGIESDVRIEKVPKRRPTGEWVYEDELVAEAKVYRKDMSHPIKVKVAYSEYVQRKKDGTITQFWQKMPLTMLAKVAESQALRKAFNIRGALDFYENIEEIDEEVAATIVKEEEKDAATLLSKKKNEENEEKKEVKELEKTETINENNQEEVPDWVAGDVEEVEIPEID